MWAGALLVLLAGPASAQPVDDPNLEAARRHFESATRAFDEGDYDLAVAEFRSAHELTSHPDLLFNIYSAAERAGRFVEAAEALERFLEEAEVADRRPALEARLARLRQRIGASRGTVEGQAADAEDGPEAAPLDAAPVASSTADATPARPPVASRPTGPHPAGLATLVGAGVLFASFGVFAALSEVEDQRLAGDCGRDRGAVCEPGAVEALEVYNVVADVSWIGGAAAAAVGILLLLVLDDGGSDSAVAMPWVTPSAAGAEVVGRW